MLDIPFVGGNEMSDLNPVQNIFTLFHKNPLKFVAFCFVHDATGFWE